MIRFIIGLIVSSSLWGQSVLLLMGANGGGAQIGTPVDSPGAGTYSSTQNVTLTASGGGRGGATICYLLTGGTPAATVPGTCDPPAVTYSGTFAVATTSTLKAIGTASGYTNSSVLTSVYTISGGGGISILSTGLGPTGSGTSSSVDTSTGSGDGLYIWGSGLNSGITVTDTCGANHNTYVQDTSYSNGSNNVVLWHADNGTGSIFTCANQTFTLTGSGFFTWGWVAAHGMKTSSSFDGTTGNNASSTTIQPGSLSPGAGRHLLLGILSAGTGSGTWTVDSGFSVAQAQAFAGGVNYDGALVTLIQASGASVNPTGTFSTSGTLVFGLYSFGGV